MTFTIKLGLVLGTVAYGIWPDAWTVVTKGLQAQRPTRARTVVTADGDEILSLPWRLAHPTLSPGRRRGKPARLSRG